MGHTMEHHHHFKGGHPGLRSFLPLLAVPLVIGVLRRMAFRRHMFMHHMGMHAGENGVPPFFAEWHRRAHEAEGHPPAPEVRES